METIASTSLPAGVFHKLDPDAVSRKLYDGDMLIMVTDGVMDALPAAHQEAVMKDIIMEHDTGNPGELAGCSRRQGDYQESGIRGHYAERQG